MIKTFYKRKEKFQKYLKKFEKCKNKKNYYKLTNFLLAKTVKVSGIFKEFKLLLTDDNNKLFFNSVLGNGNTYEKYKNGEIYYNNSIEKKLNDRSEKCGHGYKKTCEKIYYSFKVGSSATFSYLRKEEEEVGLNSTEASLINIFIIILIIGGFICIFEMETGGVIQSTFTDTFLKTPVRNVDFFMENEKYYLEYESGDTLEIKQVSKEYHDSNIANLKYAS